MCIWIDVEAGIVGRLAVWGRWKLTRNHDWDSGGMTWQMRTEIIVHLWFVERQG
jgi:hypothetical protein